MLQSSHDHHSLPFVRELEDESVKKLRIFDTVSPSVSASKLEPGKLEITSKIAFLSTQFQNLTHMIVQHITRNVIRRSFIESAR